MSKSSGLRASDVRAVYQLVGECRELGDDALAWRQHLAARVGTWAGAGVVTLFELSTGSLGWCGFADWGWETSGLDQPAWDRLMDAAHREGALINPMTGLYLAALGREDGAAVTRADLLRDEEFYRSRYYQEYQRPTGADAQMNCFRSIPGAQGGVNGLVLVRPSGTIDFALRHRALVKEVQTWVAPLVGGPLARFGEPSPAALPPRARQVLRCLLEGDTDKQVAVRLGLSRLTVNGYTKVVYQHFGVQSRAELLARWIRRGWGSRAAWAEEP